FVGLASLLLREIFLVDLISSWSERLVGVALLAIGLWGFRKALSTHVHVHEHSHNGRTHMHAHLHGHSHQPAHEHNSAHTHTHAGRRRQQPDLYRRGTRRLSERLGEARPGTAGLSFLFYRFAANASNFWYSIRIALNALTTAATCCSSGASCGVSRMISNGAGF